MLYKRIVNFVIVNLDKLQQWLRNVVVTLLTLPERSTPYLARYLERTDMPVSRRRKKNGKKTFKRKPKASGSASSSQSHQNIRDLQELSNYLDVEEARFRAGEGITGHDLSDSRIRRGMPAQKKRVEAYH